MIHNNSIFCLLIAVSMCEYRAQFHWYHRLTLSDATDRVYTANSQLGEVSFCSRSLDFLLVFPLFCILLHRP